MVEKHADSLGLGYPMEWRDYVEPHLLSSMIPEKLVSIITIDYKPFHNGKIVPR
jgi:hypothetical protein